MNLLIVLIKLKKSLRIKWFNKTLINCSKNIHYEYFEYKIILY